MKIYRYVMMLMSPLGLMACGGSSATEAASTADSSATSPAAVEAPVAEPSVAETPKSDDALVMTAQGVGPIKLGMKPAEVPTEVPGLYDKREQMKEDGCIYYVCYQKGQLSMAVFFNSDNKAYRINMFNPEIKNDQGFHAGMPVSQLKGVKSEVNDMDGDTEYYGAGFSYTENTAASPVTVHCISILAAD